VDKTGKTILVTGATGTQGGAVARALLQEGWAVRVLVRNPASPRAAQLAQRGAVLVRGDLDDSASLAPALHDVYGVFSTQVTTSGVEAEVRQGKALAEASRVAGVQHFIHASVHSADLATGVPHFESKWRIEQHLRSTGLPYTVLRPVFFMENFINYFPPAFEDGVYTLRLALHPDTRLSMIAADDIGAFTAIVLQASERYAGRAFEIGGDILTMPQVCDRMQVHTGKPFRFEELPIEAVRSFNQDYALMFELFNTRGQPLDLAQTRAVHPGVMDFSAWLKSVDWQPPA
jgi:uncharacterized protein YbjT (DUF2867 family)